MTELIMRLFKIFWKHIFGIILFFVTGVLYFFILRDGIDSFYYPMIGIFVTIAMTGVCILYLVSFRNKKNNIK